MLDVGQKVYASEKLELINIISSPQLKTHDRNRLISYYTDVVRGENKISPEKIKHDRELLLKKLRGKVL